MRRNGSSCRWLSFFFFFVKMAPVVVFVFFSAKKYSTEDGGWEDGQPKAKRSPVFLSPAALMCSIAALWLPLSIFREAEA